MPTPKIRSKDGNKKRGGGGLFLNFNVLVVQICFPKTYHTIIRHCCTIICVMCDELPLLFRLEILVSGRHTQRA
jgi:hypothetical protein